MRHRRVLTAVWWLLLSVRVTLNSESRRRCNYLIMLTSDLDDLSPSFSSTSQIFHFLCTAWMYRASHSNLHPSAPSIQPALFFRGVCKWFVSDCFCTCENLFSFCHAATYMTCLLFPAKVWMSCKLRFTSHILCAFSSCLISRSITFQLSEEKNYATITRSRSLTADCWFVKSK